MTGVRAALLALLAALPAAAADSPYRVGPGDVLEISVPADPGASRLVNVQTTGMITLGPGSDIPVGGLTVEEIGLKLSQPGIRVRVSEYRSRFAWVMGEVVRPGRTPLREATRLVDALVATGGLTEAASGEVVVERSEGSFADGSTVKSLFLSGSRPTPEELRGLEILLSPRDVVTARRLQYVHVSGAVARPGRYGLRRATLAEALEAAGGKAPRAGTRVTVSRVPTPGSDPVVLELEAGRDAETPLLTDDRVVVPGGSRGRK
jgi:polysaccharide biosynthesis/export protein